MSKYYWRNMYPPVLERGNIFRSLRLCVCLFALCVMQVKPLTYGPKFGTHIIVPQTSLKVKVIGQRSRSPRLNIGKTPVFS